MTKTLRQEREEFDRFVVKTNNCWVWQGGTNSDGYGRWRFRGRTQYAHRVAWVLKHVLPIPPGVMICHHCDNPPCVRPDHLYQGNAWTNAQDQVRRGRSRKGSTDLALVQRWLEETDRPAAAARVAGISVRHVQRLISSGAVTRPAA